MNGPNVTVIRLGHRPGRDERTTTHVGLTARALGARKVVVPEAAGQAEETIKDITDRFGGPFSVEVHTDPQAIVAEWDGPIIHLTMYGEPIQDRLEAIKSESDSNEEVLCVVGGGKVSFSIYEAADWNLAVTNQPHSEIAALAVFLDRFFEGEELGRSFENANHRVVPKAMGKEMKSVEDQ